MQVIGKSHRNSSLFGAVTPTKHESVLAQTNTDSCIYLIQT